MKKKAVLGILFALPLLLVFSLNCRADAGDEKEKKVEVAPKEPNPSTPPLEPEQPVEVEEPDVSLGQKKEPEFVELSDPAAPPKRRTNRKNARWDPDQNMDYSEIFQQFVPESEPRGVLPPALGFRGYRPSMWAASVEDRTPGFGIITEFSWNRLAVGALASFFNRGDTASGKNQGSLFGVYGLYRWLPFDVSPYFLMGVEFGMKTEDSIGGMAGIGTEMKVYSGWTLLLGYTYHSAIRRGRVGGGLGWSF